jgi:hypothetical protein
VLDGRRKILHRIIASIPWLQSALNFYLDTILICLCCSQIFELFHTFKGAAINLYILTSSNVCCRFYTQFQNLKVSGAVVASASWVSLGRHIVISHCRGLISAALWYPSLLQGAYKLSEDFAKPYYKYWTEIHDVTTIWKSSVCSFVVTLNAFDVRPTFDTAHIQAILPFPPNPLKHVSCDVPDCGVNALSQFAHIECI